MRVLLDMDGVLADWIGGVARLVPIRKDWLAVQGKRPDDPRAIFEGWDWDRLRPWDVVFAQLMPLPWAYDLDDMLSEEFGEDVWVASSPGYPTGDPADFFSGACVGKGRWICEHFPNLTRRLVLVFDKLCLASPENILVDDRESAVTRFRASGGKAVLFPAPWNDRYPEYQRLVENPREGAEAIVREVLEVAGRDERLPTAHAARGASLRRQ